MSSTEPKDSIPQEFQDWAEREAKRLYPEGSGHYRLIFGQEGVLKGAWAAYHKMQEVIQMYVDVTEDQQKCIDKLRKQLASHD